MNINLLKFNAKNNIDLIFISKEISFQTLETHYQYLNIMFIQVRIEEEKFRVCVGKGYNDWVWLAHYAARIYSKTIYPQGTYIPSLIYIETKGGECHPHPRQKINFYLETSQIPQDEFTAIVKIRKANHVFTEYQKKWELQAFGDERYFSEIKYSYKVSKVNRNKDFFFQAKITFSMSEDIRLFIDPKKFKHQYQFKLQQRQTSPTDSVFEKNIKLPYGAYTFKLFYFEREGDEYTEREWKDFLVTVEPKYVSMQKINNLVQEDMKISDSINKNLQEKELEAKKRNTNSALCCFTFEQLWGLVEENHAHQLFLSDYEQSTKQRIKITLQKSLNQLYEIFFYYFIVENQQRDKKEDLSITYQDALHFLRDYQVFAELKDLLNFIEFYNSDCKFNRIQDTLDVMHFGIKFPQFVALLFRSVQFMQTSTYMMKGETFDSAVAKIVQKIVEIETEEDEFTQLRRNIRENAKIISCVRSASEKLKKIFCVQARNSIQNSASQFCLKKEQIKRMVQMAALTEKNTDLVVEECFNELKLREDGIFYYQFLSVIQWLAMATISSGKEEHELDNDDEQSSLIVEKINFLVDKISALV